MAKARKAEHFIKNKDGTIGERNSYGNDPRNIPAKEKAMSQTPSEPPDADPGDPQEPRLNPDEGPNVDGDGDGADTLVSGGDPPSTSD